MRALRPLKAASRSCCLVTCPKNETGTHLCISSGSLHLFEEARRDLGWLLVEGYTSSSNKPREEHIGSHDVKNVGERSRREILLCLHVSCIGFRVTDCDLITRRFLLFLPVRNASKPPASRLGAFLCVHWAGLSRAIHALLTGARFARTEALLALATSRRRWNQCMISEGRVCR